MTKLRKGDTVLIMAVVADVAGYGDVQQIQVNFTPNGERGFGWMVPGEYDFQLYQHSIKVGDKVILDHAQSLDGEVKAIVAAEGLNPAYAWVKPDGRHDFRTMMVSDLRRRG